MKKAGEIRPFFVLCLLESTISYYENLISNTVNYCDSRFVILIKRNWIRNGKWGIAFFGVRFTYF